MINDHLKGTSCSIHGRSRVNEGLECPTHKTATGSVPGAAAISSCPPEQIADSAPLSQRQSVGRVAVLMCTFNGQDFLETQLQSINRQSYSNWHVAISDDGSRDATLNIANRYRYLWGEEKVSLWQGPCQGFARNFLSFICNRQLQADFFAWCDQDDIWDQGKLQAAGGWLSTHHQARPDRVVQRRRQHYSFESCGSCTSPGGGVAALCQEQEGRCSNTPASDALQSAQGNRTGVGCSGNRHYRIDHIYA